jgi:hypothetical protein
MVFSFGLAYGAQEVTLDQVSEGLYAGDSVALGKTVTFDLRETNVGGNGGDVTSFTHGFRVWTHGSGGVTDYTDNFSAISADTVPLAWEDLFDFTFEMAPALAFSVDGLGEDTVGYAGVIKNGDGFLNGWDAVCWKISTTLESDSATADGDTLCIDSSYYPPGGPFIYATTAGTILTNWGGPYCYHMHYVQNPPPYWTDVPGNATADHCVIYEDTLTAQDDFDDPPDVLNFTNNGPGNITYTPGTSPNSVVITYQPLGVGPITFDIDVDDGVNTPVNHTWTITFDNSGGVGTFTDGCGDSTAVGMGNVAYSDVDAESSDCDDIDFLICGVTPTPNGGYSIDANTGLITFNTAYGQYPGTGDGGQVFTFEVGITDGIDTVCGCDVKFDVLVTEPFEIQIEKTHLTIQGQHEYVDVYQNKGSELIGGFDLLMAYDRSALNFQKVTEGPLFTQCGYEYITYRTWFWPSYEPHFFWGGIIRVIAIADNNNGAVHPDWQCAEAMKPTPGNPLLLFTIDFVVTQNSTYECQFAPIYFFWTDCGDNTISSVSGDTLFVSREVYGFDLVGEISDPTTGFPTYTGVQDECLVDPDGAGPKLPPLQFIDFLGGGVDIACADELDDRGDMNLNGVANEIADAVVFANYFIYGFSALHINLNGQIAASDVNADGLTLTVGDLVYLIRVIVGDAPAYPKLAPVEAAYTIKSGVVSVDAEMGAALVVVENDVTPTLLAENMEMKYAYNAEENVTRVLVYSLEGNGFSGDFLNANGDVVSLELGSYDGAVVKATELPADYSLNQNYPNPFNPTTTISFNLPTNSEYTLTVYNVTGQQVEEFAGESEAGTVSIEFDASYLASGIYFYKLNAGDFSATKKMVLLK